MQTNLVCKRTIYITFDIKYNVLQTTKRLTLIISTIINYT